VESEEKSHLAWLEEFLAPQFDLSADPVHDCRVTVIEDSDRYCATLALGPGSGTLDAFTLDTRVVTLPRWQGAETRLFDAKPGVFYDIAGHPYAVTIQSTPGNVRGRTALMRVVRELATNRAQRRGGVLLHASAFAVGGKGIIVAGPKRAGKTTLLIHALRAASARYVSNDRVLIRPDAVPAVARGVPTIIALRRGTLDLFPAVAARLAAASFHHRLTLHEAAALGRVAAAPRGEVDRLSPAQFCRLLDVPPLGQCEVSALLFPRITHESGVFSTRRLPEGEAAAQLVGGLFGATVGRWTSEVFAHPGDPAPPGRDTLGDRCRRLTDRIPCFECRIGLDAYESASSADDLIASVLE
jgi:hypothetical protein